MEMIKSNNASQYLDVLKKVVESGDVDDVMKHYRINNLLQYGRDWLLNDPNESNITDVHLDLSLYNIINYRRKAIGEANEFSMKHDFEKKKLDKNKKIVELL